MVGIGFFAPLPLALMMPFMAGQSMLMGDAFGKAYQYGKRKISAMSNEEFNALTPELLGKSIVTDYNAIIPSLEEAVQSSTEFQRIIIQELGNILKSIPADVLKFFGLEDLVTTQTEGLLSFNIVQIRAWSDTELRAALEKSFHLYNAITQILITDEYNKRFKEPEEHVHVPEHHPPVTETPPPEESIRTYTETEIQPLAAGRVRFVSGTTWYLEANQLGKYVKIKSGSVANMVNDAHSAWPASEGYIIKSFATTTAGNDRFYWVQSSKLS